MPPEEATPRPQRVFVAFEGGGAKGIAHIGALRALEEAEARGDIEVAGYAGTSAGAIVAALAAAGWRSHELYDTADRHRHLLTRLSRAEGSRLPGTWAVDLLGGGWRWIRLALGIGPALGWLVSGWRAWALAAAALASVLHVYATPDAVGPAFDVLLGGVVAVAAALALAVWTVSTGLARLDVMEDVLRQALAFKLRGDPCSGDVTFSDLREAGKPALHIVATDISDRGLHLFPADGGEGAPDPGTGRRSATESVAAAVAASACIPVVFHPRRIGKRRFYDGGLVSNLPAWAFDDELRLDDRATVIGIKIETDEDGRSRRYDGPLAGLTGLVRTVIFGSAPLNTRNIPQLHLVELSSKLRVLQFDADHPAIVTEIENAYRRTRDNIVQPLVVYDRELSRIAGLAAQYFSEYVGELRAFASNGARRYDSRVRAAFLLPVGTPPIGLRIRYTWGYEDAPDDRLTLPIANSVSGMAWEGAEGVAILDPSRPKIGEGDLSWPQYRVAKNRAEAAGARYIAALRIELPRGNLLGTDRCVLAIDAVDPPGLTPEREANVAEAIRAWVTDELDDILARGEDDLSTAAGK